MRLFAIVLLAGSLRLSAQISDQLLLDKGNAEMSRSNYVDGYAYYFAYYSRFPLGMQLDPNHANQVTDMLRTVRTELARRMDESDRFRSGGNQGGSSGLGAPRPHIDQPSGQTSQSRWMICQGGGNLTFRLQPKGYGTMMFVIRFRPGTGAGQDALQPGECTWFDRAVDSSEPKEICHTVPAANLAMQWTTNGQISTIESNFPYLRELMRPGSYFKFAVLNNGQGCMVVTRLP